MSRIRFKKPTTKKLLWISIAISILPIFYLIMNLCGIVFTYTGSLPTGFYYQKNFNNKIQIGQIVSFCLPQNIAKYGYDRGYIGEGNCQGGYAALMKEVVAIPGDDIVINDNDIIVNHKVYYAPVGFHDSHGLTVKRFVNNGSYKATGYWFYGFGSPTYSWDSRYYGEVPQANILHEYKPLLVF